MNINRRNLIGSTFKYAGAIAVARFLAGCNNSGSSSDSSPPSEIAYLSNIENTGSLQAADSNGLMLPEGFTSRVIAQSGQLVAGSNYPWHGAPDGGACFSTADGGWVYVSNCELINERGGAGAIRFSASGEIIDAYSMLSGTNKNCAGGATPWGTWLSCEEVLDIGRVFECDPLGQKQAVELPALGYFKHEAAAYDLVNHQLYLTEDLPDGGLYRFTPDALRPDGFADLSKGRLDILQLVDTLTGKIAWHPIEDPGGFHTPLRKQVDNSSAFNGGEGIDYYQGVIYFTTKGDNHVWALDIATQTLKIIYSAEQENPILKGVDNITISSAGDILVAEDAGNMQIVAITPLGSIKPLVQIEGHSGSEVTGPAFSPDQTRLYFSSQRGVSNKSSGGITYEVAGPFFHKV